MCPLVLAMLLEVVLCTPGFAAHLTAPETNAVAFPPADFDGASYEAPQPVQSLWIRPLLERKRPPSLPALYASAAALQSYDTVLTMRLVGGGHAHETNPLMKTVTGNPVAFVAVKAGVTAMVILTAEHLWKNHNRTQAVALMLATNVIMGVVAAQNTRALR
jgi:hypothetical protein